VLLPNKKGHPGQGCPSSTIFSARLKTGAKRILMNTRWHEEDVAGRVLEQIERKEVKGRVISIPAIAIEFKVVMGLAFIQDTTPIERPSSQFARP
jgi:hypothetical protein